VMKEMKRLWQIAFLFLLCDGQFYNVHAATTLSTTVMKNIPFDQRSSLDISAVSFLQYLDDKTVSSPICAILSVFTVTNAILSIAYFVVNNRWLLFSNVYPFETSLEELAHEKLGLYAVAWSTLSGMVSASCYSPRDPCEASRMIGTMVSMSAFVLMFWGITKSAYEFEKERQEKMHKEVEQDADFNGAVPPRITPGYAWRLNQKLWQREGAESGSLSSTAAVNQEKNDEADKLAYDKVKEKALMKKRFIANANPNISFRTNFKMFFGNRYAQVGLLAFLLGIVIAWIGCSAGMRSAEAVTAAN